MKTFLKILAILIVLIIVLALLLPMIFKGKITELAKEEINKNVEATVDFQDINLSLLKNFPNFSLGIKEIVITGVDEFENDTLANIKAIDVTLDIFSVISGNNYEIKKIIISQPYIFVKVTKEGKANYDIAPKDESKPIETEKPKESSPFALTLKKFEIQDGKVIYKDDKSGMLLEIIGLNHSLMGNLTSDFTTLRTNTTIDQFTLNFGGVNYFSKTNIKYKADIEADLKNEIYTVSKNELKLNELVINFDGSVSMVNEDINLVLTFNAPKTNFKNILSLVPAIYAKDFQSIETDGSLSLEGHVKGLYNENNLPAFALNLSVDNGMFKYPDLPKAVTDIDIKARISNRGGDADNTLIDVSRLNLKMAENPINISLLVKTPISDPDINGRIKGQLDLAKVSEFYPLAENEKLNGTFITDITLKGKLSAVENKQYENFTALGSMLINGFEYASNSISEPIKIGNAQLNFSPSYLDLVSFSSKIGDNDLTATGKIENYLAYIFKDEVLKGELTTHSKFFNISALMPEKETGSSSEETSSDTSSMSVIEIPANIDFTLSTTFNKLIYDNIEMENVGGYITIKDQKLNLENLSMNLLDGEMVINGSYNAIDINNPEFDFNLDIDLIDIQKAYNTFDIVSKYAPIAKKTTGKLSTTVKLKSNLTQNMMPDFKTMLGNGELETGTVKIADVNTLDKIGDILKMESLKSFDIEKILLQFEFLDGKIMIDPFDVNINKYSATLGGWTGFDQSIEYALNMNIPRDAFGSTANNILNDLVNQVNAKGANFSLGETVSLDLLIGGTLTNPEIKTALKQTGKSLVEDVTEQIKEEIQKKKEEISQQAREQAQKILDEADQQAQKIIGEAEKQADNLRKTASDAAKKLTDEADKQGASLIAEGKKNGFLAEAAAKESAKLLTKEADNNANKLISEADKQANGLVNKAKREAGNLKKNAQKEADKLLGK